jgi:mannose-1-phosphate guanylyltransferase/phosphomannomutase
MLVNHGDAIASTTLCIGLNEAGILAWPAVTAALNLRAVVFAAGEGTRLRPLTADRPKPMVPVGGRPILGYILAWLSEQGISGVGINLHYRPKAIEEWVERDAPPGLAVCFSRETVLLGSAGALGPFAPFLRETGHPFVAVYGDTLSTLALAPLLAWHERSGVALTIAVMEHPNPTEAGIVDLVETSAWHGGVAGRIARIQEKPAAHEVFSTIANAGVFVMSPRILDRVPEGRASDIARDLIPNLLSAGERVSGWLIPPSAVVWDVGTWASYERAQREWPAVWAARTIPGVRSTDE